jgi:hypothetical protein
MLALNRVADRSSALTVVRHRRSSTWCWRLVPCEVNAPFRGRRTRRYHCRHRLVDFNRQPSHFRLHLDQLLADHRLRRCRFGSGHRQFGQSSDLKNSVHGLRLSLGHLSGYLRLETIDNSKLQNAVVSPNQPC